MRMITEMRFGPAQLEYLRSADGDEEFLAYLEGFRFSGDIEAMPEGTIAFANEPLVRVTAPLIEAQLVETLLLNQINFQTMIATKAARVVMAANGDGESVMDFSPRRDHGVDAAMKAARASAIAGVGGTSNVAAAYRYGLRAVGTMAHSYVLSFDSEEEAFETFIETTPTTPCCWSTPTRRSRGSAAGSGIPQDAGVPLLGIRIDRGTSRRLPGRRGCCSTRRDSMRPDHRLRRPRGASIARCAAGCRSTSGGSVPTRHQPGLPGGQRRLQDRRRALGRGMARRRQALRDEGDPPGAKQVFRRFREGTMSEDVSAPPRKSSKASRCSPPQCGRGGNVVAEPLEEIREGEALVKLAALPPGAPPPEQRKPGGHTRSGITERLRPPPKTPPAPSPLAPLGEEGL